YGVSHAGDIRGLSPGGEGQAAAPDVRLCRWRFLCRRDTQAKHGGLRRCRAAPARHARRLETLDRHRALRPETGDAAGARAGRNGGASCEAWRGAGGESGEGRRAALLPLDLVDLRPRGSLEDSPALVSALRAEGPRLYARTPGAGEEARLARAGLHRGPAR